jgi:hypothetical protein
MMSDTYGPTFALPSMRYDLNLCSWRTCEATSLWDLEMSSPTFSEWGMTLAGELYELPMPALRTGEQEFSSLPTPTARDYRDASMPPRLYDGRGHGSLPEKIAMLPTPTAGDGTKASANPETSARRIRKGQQAFLTDIVQTKLLPTPTTQDRQPGHASQLRRNTVPLNTLVTHLLPTPLARDHKDMALPESKVGKHRAQSELPTILNQIHLGVNMSQQLGDGSGSSQGAHPPQHTGCETETQSTLPLWNG